MFERFTDKARTAVIAARAEASERGDQIRPVYLLHALAAGEGVAARALAGLGVDTDTIERRMDRAAPLRRQPGGEAAGEDAKLARILAYGPANAAVEARGELMLVVPRIGTISPWSSKATDIARVCGLEHIRRLERGTLYFIEASTNLSAEDVRALGSLLHDRMTESVWIGVDDPAGTPAVGASGVIQAAMVNGSM
jgi:hypothetical protein